MSWSLREGELWVVCGHRVSSGGLGFGLVFNWVSSVQETGCVFHGGGGFF